MVKRWFAPTFVSTAQRFSSSSDNPQKDNFHNLIFDIDKTLASGTVDPGSHRFFGRAIVRAHKAPWPTQSSNVNFISSGENDEKVEKVWLSKGINSVPPREVSVLLWRLLDFSSRLKTVKLPFVCAVEPVLFLGKEEEGDEL